MAENDVTFDSLMQRLMDQYADPIDRLILVCDLIQA